MKSFSQCLVITLLVARVILLDTQAHADEFRPSPPMKSRELPQPPRQKDPWTAPQSTLPAQVITATATLFQLGLADPRGCEYRVIEVGTGSCWTGDNGVVTTHGWVLPKQPNAVEQFAACWNGLVHPVITVGDKADLRADVEAMLAPATEPLDAEADFRRLHSHDEAAQLGFDIRHSLKICLMLRLGHADLAQRIWNEDSLRHFSSGRKQAEADDPFHWLAHCYAWNLFDRALGAHMRRDDRLALASVRLLSTLQVGLENANEQRKGDPLQIGFLDSLPDLLTDQERRAKQPIAEPAPRAAGAEANLAERIAALIRELENVDARQQGQPGGIRLTDDPRVAALIQAGDAAIEPLIACLESDARMTRSVHFWRDFDHDRTIITVYEAAFTALENILGASFFQTASTGDALSAREPVFRKYTAEKVRKYWSKYGNRPAAERWYAMLKDYDAAPALWLEAANNIVESNYVTVSRGTMFFTDQVSIAADSGERPAMRGESLRDGRSPSVSALISRSARQLLDQEPADPLANPEEDAVQLALILCGWDEPEGVKLLKQLLNHCADRAADRPTGTRTVVSLTLALAPRDEESALGAYATCFRSWEPPTIRYAGSQLFKPLWRYPQNAQAKQLVDWILNATHYRTQADTIDYLPYFVTTPLITLPPVRQRVLESLGNKALVERKVFETKGDTTIDDLILRAPASEPPIRLCDFYASQLAQLSGLPKFDEHWTVAKRDEAVTAIAKFMRKHGSQFAAVDDDSFADPYRDDRPTVQLVLPELDHPATAADVNQGRAIFSLGEGREVRQSKLPKRPAEARRVAADADSPSEPSAGRYTPPEDRLLVWQAEEVRTASGWERFYGVVAQTGLAQVPAGEIEFLSGSQFQLSRGLDATIVPPTTVKRLRFSNPLEQRLSDPLIVQLKLCNRRGVAQQVPTEYLRKSPTGPLLIQGMELKLLFSAGDAGGRADWKALPVKPHGRFQPGPASRTLDSLEELVALELDLREWFDIGQSGVYRLHLQFTSESGGFVDGEVGMLLLLKSEVKP